MARTQKSSSSLTSGPAKAGEPTTPRDAPAERRAGAITGQYQIKTLSSAPVAVIRQGLPVSAVDDVVKSGVITSGEVYEVILPRKTLTNRRATGTLTPDQSDRLVRVARVIEKAEEVFANREKAHIWLRRPTTALDGEEPIKLLDTEVGARKVEELLNQIAYGIAA